jgi:hypothetical protein
MHVRQPITGIDFSARYQLLKQLTDGEVRTLSAVTTATGMAVMVHYLVGSREENELVIARVAELPEPGSRQVIELLDIEGHQAIVTHVISAFSSFGEWLNSQAMPTGERTTEVEVVSEPNVETSSVTAELQPEPAEALMQAEATQPLAVEPGPQPDEPRAQPGEFTRLFGAVAPSEPTAAPSAPPTAPTATPSAPPPSAPSEFTRLFGAPQVPMSVHTPAPPHTLPPALPSIPPPPVAPPPAPLPPPPFVGGGAERATSILNVSAPQPQPPSPQSITPPVTSPSVLPPPIMPPPPAAMPMTPLPAMSPSAIPSLAPATPPPAGAPPAAIPHASFQGPSEYTRVLAGSALPGAMVPPSPAPVPTPPGVATTPTPAQQPAQPATAKSYLPLILTLNVVVLAALALVLYFAFKR